MSDGEEQIYLSGSHSTPVMGKGKILLILTSGKILSLNNVLHVPNIRYNLISVFVIGKAGVKVSFEGDKIVMTKNRAFIGKRYCFGDLFKINVPDTIINNKAFTSAYIVNSVDLRHGRFSHVNYSYLKKMKDIGLLSNINVSNIGKCVVYVESKSTKRTYKLILNREIELLSLIHSDLGDLKQTMTRGDKRLEQTMTRGDKRL